MESVLQKISEKKFDSEVHGEFIKYSKGSFPNKYLIDAKKQKSAWSVKTSADLANFLVKTCASTLSAHVHMTGAIIATFDLKSALPFPISNVKQFMGIKQCVIDSSIDPKQLVETMHKYPRAFFALSFKGHDFELKIKAKAPKSAKPAATGDKEVKAEFCSLKTSNHTLIKSLFFDTPDFTEISINHTLNITAIELPKNEPDPVKLRENAKRKGVLVRRIRIAEKDTLKDFPFEA